MTIQGKVIPPSRRPATATLEPPRQESNRRASGGFLQARVEAPNCGSDNLSRAGPMLLAIPLHGRALRPTDRPLAAWKVSRRTPPDTARGPMRRPAVSSGPTCDQPGRPSVPLRARRLIGETNDQAWFSSLVGSRLLSRAGAESHRITWAPQGLALWAPSTRRPSIQCSERPNERSRTSSLVFCHTVGHNCDRPKITPACALFATWPGPRRPSAAREGQGYAATQPDLGCASRTFVGNPGTLLDEPFRGCLGLVAKISWIDGRRMIWMQEAFRDFDPIIRNTKHVFVLRALVMNTHLFRPQHHQSKFSGRVVHVQPHLLSTRQCLPPEVNVTLIPPPGKAVRVKNPGAPAGPGRYGRRRS